MTKWAKRLSVSGLALFGAIVVLLLVCWILLRGTPEWYQPTAMTPQQRDAAAQRATRKLADVQNEAALARARERSGRNRGAGATTTADNAIVISFTDDEINACFESLAVMQSVKASYERFLTDPYLVLKDGRLIVAGKMKEVDAIVSLHFEPRIDPLGRLDLRLARVLAGKLPLPEVLFSKYQDKATSGITQRLPVWRQQASIDSTGIANDAAISALLGQQLIDLFHKQPAEPILFLHLLTSGSIPVRLSELSIRDHSLTLTVHPMTPDQRSDLLQRIRDGSSLASDDK